MRRPTKGVSWMEGMKPAGCTWPGGMVRSGFGDYWVWEFCGLGGGFWVWEGDVLEERDR